MKQNIFIWILRNFPNVSKRYRKIRYRYLSWKSLFYLGRFMGKPQIEELKLPNLIAHELIPTTSDENRFDINPSVTVVENCLTVYFRRTNTSVRPVSDEYGNMNMKRNGSALKNSLQKMTINRMGETIDQEELISEDEPLCIEDVRAYTRDDKTYLLGTAVLPPNLKTGEPWQTKVAYSDGKEFSIIRSPVGKRFEKNWIPITVDNNNLYLIHGNNPPLIICLDLVTSVETTQKFRNLKKNLVLSGGSPCIETPDGSFLRIARRRIALFNRGFVHISYLVKLDEDFNEVALSKPFIFQTLGFEIANGLVLDGDDIFLSWGENDSKMFLASIPLSKMQTWFSSNLHQKYAPYKVFRNVWFLKKFLARNLEV